MPGAFHFEKLTRYRDRAMTSFIVDDICVTAAEQAEAYRRFSSWVEEAGLKGETSAILGMQRDADGRALPPHPAWIAEMARAQGRHLEFFMELMTHWTVYDFARDRLMDGAPHECVWLNDRNRGLEECMGYLGSIVRRGADLGIRFSGLTQPGCGCPACLDFFTRNQLHWDGKELNPRVHEALLLLAREGRLAGPIAGEFIGWVPRGPTDLQLLAESGAQAVYDLTPGFPEDRFGSWDNNPDFVRIDEYISADGQGGRMAELLALGTRTLIYYTHWGCVRPDTGRGFAPFQEVAARLQRHHGERIVWMRPTEIAAYRHTERHTQLLPARDGRSFRLSIPFPPLHALSLRVLGGSGLRLRAPSGSILEPSRQLPGASGSDFDLLPENGTYTVQTAAGLQSAATHPIPPQDTPHRPETGES